MHRWSRWLVGRSLPLGLLISFACAPAVRPTGSETLKVGAGPPGVDTALPGQVNAPRVPPPPAAVTPPAYDPISRIQLENGPHLCGAKRPDLAHAFVAFDLVRDLPPEETLLLREWIRAAWLRELSSSPLLLPPVACENHFLCFSGPAEDAEPLVSALLRALAAPGQAAFYQARPTALRSAEVWDINSADWKLNTSARALRALPAATSPPGHSHAGDEPQVDNAALLSVVRRQSGSTKAAALSFASLEMLIRSALSGSTVTVVGPSLSARDLTRHAAQWTRKSAKREPIRRTVSAPGVPLLLEKDAGELTHAALVWEVEESSARRAIETALSLLILRSEKHNGETARVRVQAAGGLYSAPTLRVEGPHEQVMTALAKLSEEYDRFISAYGAPSGKEWDKAEFRTPPTPHLEPRCGGEPHLGSAQAAALARELLRVAGPPTVVVWGTDAPREAPE